MRSRYWSHSWLATWLRKKFKLPELECGTSAEWKEWRVDSNKIAPLIHWFTDDALNEIQSFFSWPKDKLWDLRCALNARYFDKYHSLSTGLNHWQYHEVDSRILHGLFNTLVDFVEIEKAWMHVIWGQRENQKKFGYTWFEMNGWFNWIGTEKRHPDAGVEYLIWEMSLMKDDNFYGCDEKSIQQAKESGEYGTMTPQALGAKEIFDLYHWWKNTRPARVDPMEVSGLSAYYDEQREKNDGNFLDSFDTVKTDEERQSWIEMHDECTRLEKLYEDEDTEMMIRLVKLRKSLWT